MMNTGTYLSIDFGTSNTLVGAVKDGRKIAPLELDPCNADKTIMRTLLYFPHAEECFYGAQAIEEYVQHSMEGRLFRSFKSHLPNKSYLGTVLDNRILTLETLIGTFLLEIKKRAEKILGETVDKAIIGRPARYSMDDVEDGFALHRMKKAAEFAGFKEIHFIPEPLAAAFDYRASLTKEKIALIGDFGGGTSDFTIIKINPSEFSKKDVLAIEGCPLAGDALDSLFMSERLNVHFGAKTKYRLPMSENVLTMPKNISLRLNKPAHIVHLNDKETYEFIKNVRKWSLSAKDAADIDRLFALIEDQQIFSFFEQIESTKRDLSEKQSAHFEFSYPDIEVAEDFARQDFIRWAQEFKTQVFAAVSRALQDAQLQPEQIDLVALTGGTSKVPFIKDEFINLFGAQKIQNQSQFHSVITGLTEAAFFISQDIEVL